MNFHQYQSKSKKNEVRDIGYDHQWFWEKRILSHAT